MRALGATQQITRSRRCPYTCWAYRCVLYISIVVTVRVAETTIDVICDDANEFVALLDPVHGLFAEMAFIFRGVASNDYDLMPSAHRRTARLVTAGLSVIGPRTTLRAQCEAEFVTLKAFFDTAVRHGIRLPEDSFALRAEIEEWGVSFADDARLVGRAWPPPELFSLIALAQHYGVPTRALDWSQSSYVAAYFAASSALQSPTGKYFAV